MNFHLTANCERNMSCRKEDESSYTIHDEFCLEPFIIGENLWKSETELVFLSVCVCLCGCHKDGVDVSTNVITYANDTAQSWFHPSRLDSVE